MAKSVLKTCKRDACRKYFTGHPNKKFCSKRCKDRHHNVTNPRGKFAHYQRDKLTEEELVRRSEERRRYSEYEEACAAMEEGWDGHKNTH